MWRLTNHISAGTQFLFSGATGNNREICRGEWCYACSQAFYSSLGYFYKRIYGKEASPKEFLLQHHGLLRQSIVTRHCYLNQRLSYHPFVLSFWQAQPLLYITIQAFAWTLVVQVVHILEELTAKAF